MHAYIMIKCYLLRVDLVETVRVGGVAIRNDDDWIKGREY